MEQKKSITKFAEGFGYAAEKLVLTLGILLFAFLSVFSMFFTTYYGKDYSELPLEKPDLFFLTLLLGLCLVAFFFFAGKKILGTKNVERSIRILLTVTLIYTLAVNVVWVLISHCGVVADQEFVTTLASQFLEGDYSAYYNRSYLQVYPHQLGLITLIELVFRIFGDKNYLAFQLINAVGVTLCVYVSYRITEMLFQNHHITILYLLLSMGCFPLYIYSGYVYGEILSLLFALTSGWMVICYARKEQMRYAVLAALCISLSILIRSNNLIVLIALAGVLAVIGISRRKLKPFLVMALMLLSVWAGRTALFQTYEMRLGASLGEGAPMVLWIAMGMQEGVLGEGGFNGYIPGVYYHNSNLDNNQSVAIAKEDIRKSWDTFMEDPAYMLKFYRNKFANQWNDPTYQCFLMTNANSAERGAVANSMYDGKLKVIVDSFLNVYQLTIYLSVFAFFVVSFRKKTGIETYLLLIMIIGGFLFHMIWEAKGRYILPYFVMMLPYAAAGIPKIGAGAIRLAEKVKKKKLQ